MASNRAAPSSGDRHGKQHVRLRSAQHGSAPWNISTLYGYWGTVTREGYDVYHHGDCPVCLEQDRALRKVRTDATLIEPEPPEHDAPAPHLQVECWCGRGIVSVEPKLVARGVTASCHRETCREGCVYVGERPWTDKKRSPAECDVAGAA